MLKRLKEQGLIDENLGLNLPDKPLTEQEFLKLPKKDLQKYRGAADKQNMTSCEVYKKIFNDKQVVHYKYKEKNRRVCSHH